MTEAEICNISVDPRLTSQVIKRLSEENLKLKKRLDEIENGTFKPARKKVTNAEFEEKKEEILRLRSEKKTMQEISDITGIPLTMISPFLFTIEGDKKVNGVVKAHKAESIRSYSDYVAIRDYLFREENRHRYRDRALWMIGVSAGLRISDVVELRFSAFIDEEGKFRPRLFVYETKNKKLNNILITESMRFAVGEYIESLGEAFCIDDYIFMSQMKKRMTTQMCHHILKSAQRALELPISVGSHTMRSSFLNIAACVDDNTVDMNMYTKIQGLANHSSVTTTLRYLGTYQQMFDRARESVSDFLMGRTDTDELIAGRSGEDISDKLDKIIDMLG